MDFEALVKDAAWFGLAVDVLPPFGQVLFE